MSSVQPPSPPPPALPAGRPSPLVRWLATGLGSGLSPIAPGTAGSIAALPGAALLVWLGGPWLLLAGAVIVGAVGVWISDSYCRAVGREDPPEVVIDEVAGQWLTLVVAPLDPLSYALGLLAFRLFDIAKPWPVGLIDRRLPGGAGIMADDLMAGVYGAALLALLLFLLPMETVLS